MRKAITHASFHPDVKGWTYEQFVERYKDQFTPEELAQFAGQNGLKPSKSKADEEPVITDAEEIVVRPHKGK
jgi:hypothetical protein